MLVGPTFLKAQQKVILDRLVAAGPVVKDALLVAVSWFAKDRELDLDGTTEDECYSRAASAVARLGSIHVSSEDPQSLRTCLVACVAILSFPLSWASAETLLLCRYTLNTIKHAYKNVHPLLEELDDLAVFLAVNYHESVQCLIHGAAPSLRLEPLSKYKTYVDRFFGLSWPLVSYFYDLAQLNNSLYHADPKECIAIYHALAFVEHQLRSWQPNPPTDLLARFTSAEILHLSTQAQLWRLTLLLVAHRMRYPFGMEDSTASLMAQEILHQLEFAGQVTGYPVNAGDFSFVLACFEIDSPEERAQVIQKMDHLVKMTMDCRRNVTGVLTSFWKSKSKFHDISWRNLAEHLPGVSLRFR